MKHMNHQSVLKNEIIQYLDLPKRELIIDATLGLGGHSEAILSDPAFHGTILGIDQDHQMLSAAQTRLARFGSRFESIHDNFRNLFRRIRERAITFDGILFDLGVASPHFDEPERGFSFQTDTPLDMRLNQDKKNTAADFLAKASEIEIRRILFEYGEEPFARKIAQKIVEERSGAELTTNWLSSLVSNISRSRGRPRNKIHPATKTFQALRIKVNDELNALQEGLQAAIDVIEPGGRILVISYHSLEDRIVKTMFRKAEHPCICPPKIPECCCGKKPMLQVITKKPIIPTEKETRMNPRARSAKMRVAICHPERNRECSGGR